MVQVVARSATMRELHAVFSVVVVLGACGSPAEPGAPPAAPPEPVAEAPAPAEPASAPLGADLLCASVVVVAWQGAVAADPALTRTRDEARARAEAIHARLVGGEDFATVARAESDARSSGPRGGLLGTYGPEDWPAAHAAIRPGVASLAVGATSDVLEAPYGWVIARRCPVELVHSRHILVRFAGARNAPEELTRSREEARALIDAVRLDALAPGADFAALARDRSEDGSAERGGDVGTLGRGRLAAEYEAAVFSLAEGAISDVVETDVGFHVIQRLAL